MSKFTDTFIKNKDTIVYFDYVDLFLKSKFIKTLKKEFDHFIFISPDYNEFSIFSDIDLINEFIINSKNIIEILSCFDFEDCIEEIKKIDEKLYFLKKYKDTEFDLSIDDLSTGTKQFLIWYYYYFIKLKNSDFNNVLIIDLTNLHQLTTTHLIDLIIKHGIHENRKFKTIFFTNHKIVIDSLETKYGNNIISCFIA
jgi:hypothetical protein